MSKELRKFCFTQKNYSKFSNVMRVSVLISSPFRNGSRVCGGEARKTLTKML